MLKRANRRSGSVIRAEHPHKRRGLINRIVENDLIKKVSYDEYRDKVRDVYSGKQGAFLATASLISLHTAFGNRLFRERRFDLGNCTRILDVGSGAGQIAKHLLAYSDHKASIVCCDLSPKMLSRARTRLQSSVPAHIAADLSQLPFADASFDCITCGYVLEHLPDPRHGLAEMARVLCPGGKMLLLTTEDNFSGAFTSRIWACRTYNRQEIRQACHEVGLEWHKELWFSRLHKLFKAGGICVELRRQ